MEPDRLGPILRPLFKNIKELLKELVGGDAVLSFRKGPSGKVEDLKSVIWDKAFGCQVKVENISDDGIFVLMDRNGGIFLSGKMLVLPKSNIDELMKKNEVNESILDAQKEIFNMVVGKIDDILREYVEKDMHLIMGNNFIVSAADPSFIPADQEYVSYTSTVKVVGPVTFSMGILINEEVAKYITKHISHEEDIEGDMDEQKDKDKEEKNTKLRGTETKKETAHEAFEKNKKRAFVSLVGGREAKNAWVEEVMEEDFPVAQLGSSLWDALFKMRRYGMEYIILVDGLKFIGLITLADIRKGLSPFLEEPFKDYCREQDIATKSFNVEWFLEREITPVDYQASLEEVLETYLNQDTPYLPVCKSQRIMGVITHKKLVHYITDLLFNGDSNAQDSETKVAATDSK